jgi:hypothetical protein
MKFCRILTAACLLAALVCLGPASAQEEPKEKPEPAPEVKMTQREMAAVEKFIALRVEKVKEALAVHNYEFAVSLIDALLLVHPETESRGLLHELRIKAGEGLLQQEVVRTYLYSARRIYAPGEKIEVKLRVKNVSGGDVTFPHSSETPRNFGRIVKTSCSFELAGSSRMRRTQLIVKQDEPITLGKGQVWEKSYEIDTSADAGDQSAVRRYVLQAELRPAQIEAGEERFSRYLLTGELELWVVPKERAALADKPLENVREATAYMLGARDPAAAVKDLDQAHEAAFYSCFFLAESDRPEAVRLLMAALEKATADTARVLMGCLTWLTGEPHGSAKEDWLQWWKKRRKEE